MENGVKFFKTYFKYLKLHSTKCDSLITEAHDKLLPSLSGTAYVLMQILRCDLENEIHSRFPDLREKVLAESYTVIDDKLKSIWAIENEINNGTKELKMHLHELELLPWTGSNDVAEETISGLNGLHPSFDDLGTMASDAWRYYHDLWLNIHAQLSSFNSVTDKASLTRLQDAFKEDEAAKKHLKYILALTSFLIED